MSSHTSLNHAGRATIALTISSVALTTIATGLRFTARRIKHVPLGLDDWFAFMAEFIFWAFGADVLVGIYTLGAGQVYPDPAEAQQKYVQYMKSEYALVPPYILSVTFVKLSILCLYRRIFPASVLHTKINVVIVVCLLWFVASMIAALANCRPVSYFWDKTGQGYCLNFPALFMATQLADSLIDVAVIGLPIPTILQLHLNMRKRLGVVGLFLLGSLVLVTGPLRIVYMYKPGKIHVALTEASIWSVVHTASAIICACLPTFPPIFRTCHSGYKLCIRRLWHGRASDTDLEEHSYFSPGDNSTHGSHRRQYGRLHIDTSDTVLLVPAKVKKLDWRGERL